jgi:hypothetical protein
LKPGGIQSHSSVTLRCLDTSSDAACRLTVFVERGKAARVRFGLLQKQSLAVAESQVVRGREIPHSNNVSLGTFRSPNALRPSVPVCLALKRHCKRRRSNQNHLRLSFDYHGMVDDRGEVAAKLSQCDLSLLVNTAGLVAVGCPGIIRPKPQYLSNMRKVEERKEHTITRTFVPSLRNI